jgi:hypothetical protein
MFTKPPHHPPKCLGVFKPKKPKQVKTPCGINPFTKPPHHPPEFKPEKPLYFSGHSSLFWLFTL